MGDMESYTVSMDKAGRVLIPAGIRKELGFTEGAELLVRVNPDGALELYTREQAIRRAQAFFAKYKKPGRSIVDELIEDRRKEAEAEFAD